MFSWRTIRKPAGTMFSLNCTIGCEISMTDASGSPGVSLPDACQTWQNNARLLFCAMSPYCIHCWYHSVSVWPVTGAGAVPLICTVQPLLATMSSMTSMLTMTALRYLFWSGASRRYWVLLPVLLPAGPGSRVSEGKATLENCSSTADQSWWLFSKIRRGFTTSGAPAADEPSCISMTKPVCGFWIKQDPEPNGSGRKSQSWFALPLSLTGPVCSAAPGCVELSLMLKQRLVDAF